MTFGVKRIGMGCLIIFLFVLLLAGCWDSNDIEARSNVLAIAIDKADPEAEQEQDDITMEEGMTASPQGDMLQVTAQVAIPGEVPLGPGMAEGGGGPDPVWVLHVTGYSLQDALSRLQQQIAEELFLGHLRVIVVHEDVAREGVDRFNTSLLREPDVRRTAWMVVSQEEAAQYMDLAPALEDIPTLYLAHMVENSVGLGKFPDNYLGLFWRMLSSQGQDGYLPYLKMRGDEQIQINGLAYFRDDQMIGEIDPINIGTFMALTDEEQGGYEFFSIVPGTDAHVLNHTDMRETKINTEIRDGKPYANITVRYELVINETIEDDDQLRDSKVIENIEEAAKKENTDAAERLIQEMQDEKSDIFGFGEYIRAKHPGYWNQHIGTKEQWRDAFQDMDVDVDYIIQIRRVGTQAT
ncbi:Ger(x)C family spore germination protein [Natribacillus halophilus]|uniref:Spore germination B3/ GerAC like, C-terminal n=1 Tax=Natribacillus halophilus TaxID=549003 RepID=A0A1G8KSB6_9BACI|nr:Ger(x)C family spore germination protein [Natribacillus halophilus]SDI46253.1 Spore germination B3/ GerAC like, C-terminal [Natribacillus halophilus]